MGQRLRFIYFSNRFLLDVQRGFVWQYVCLLLASVCSFFWNRCLSYLRASRCRFRASKLSLRPSKTTISAKMFDYCCKSNGLHLMMVLKSFWGSLGIMFGAVAGVWKPFGWSWGSRGDPLATSDRSRRSSSSS